MDKNIYCGMFDESCANFMGDRNHNLLYLRYIQNYCNDFLKVHGYISLYEVLMHVDSFRTERLSEEEKNEYRKLGWTYDCKDGDNFVDFGLFDAQQTESKDPAIFISFNL